MFLHYSDYNPSNNDSANNNSNKKGMTRKRRSKIKNLLKTTIGGMGEGDDSNLADFNPPPKPELTKVKEPENQNTAKLDDTDNPVQPNDYNSFNNEEVNQQYYQSYVPYYTQIANQQNVNGDKSQLLEKLNYMITLLEEQKEHKTDNITEELILYMFLGVFVIFVVDSFARAGKYTR